MILDVERFLFNERPAWDELAAMLRQFETAPERRTSAEELERFRAQGFQLTVSEPAFEFLVRRGVHKSLGARPMKRAVQKFLGDAIRDALKCRTPSSGIIVLSPTEDRLMVFAPNEKITKVDS